MKKQMAAVVMGTAALSACGPAVVVQAFGVPTAPSCTVEATGPVLSRGVLDLTATTRYASVIKARTAPDSAVAVNEAEVAFRLDLSFEDAQRVSNAAQQVAGGGGLACDETGCGTSAPLLVPTVMTEAGIVEDERILLLSTDLIPASAGEALAAVFAEAEAIDPNAPIDTVTATVEVTLLDSGGGRSLPATYVIDLCRGCLAPDDGVCFDSNATAQPLDTLVCLPGQDVASSFCACTDGTPAPAGGCP